MDTKFNDRNNCLLQSQYDRLPHVRRVSYHQLDHKAQSAVSQVLTTGTIRF